MNRLEKVLWMLIIGMAVQQPSYGQEPIDTVPAGIPVVQAAADTFPVETPKVVAPPRPAGLPVVFNEDTLWSVYSPLGEFTAQERAEAIVVMLRQLARNTERLDSLRATENEGVTDVLLDTLRVFSVTTSDAAAVGKSREETALEYLELVKTSVRSRRTELTMRELLQNVGIVAGLILGIVLVLWVLAKIFPRAYDKLESWEGKIFRPLRFRGQDLISAGAVGGFFIILFKGLRLAITLMLFYFFITYALSLFPYTKTWNVAPFLRGVFYTIVATAAALAILRALNASINALSGKIEGWRGTIIKPIRVKTVELFSEERIVEFTQFGIKAARLAGVIVVAYFYLTIIFSFFEFSKTWAGTLLGYIIDPLTNVFSAVIGYLPNLFFIAVIVAVTRYLVKFVRLIFTEVERGTISFTGFSREWADPTYKIVRFLILAFAVIVIFPYLPGSDSEFFQGISVFIGVLFSLGSTSAIANVVAGVVLTYMKPFKIGDRVKIADTMGDVVEKTLLVTRVRTIKNVDITIPNAMVLGGHIINFSSSAKDRGLILHTTVTIGYDAPWKQVHELLVSAALATSHILKEPAPFVLQTSLDDFYPSYELNAYTDNPAIMARIYSELHQNIQDKFNEGGVEILSPHYSAVRDGNTVTHPPSYLPENYQAPAFRIFPLGNLFGKPDSKK